MNASLLDYHTWSRLKSLQTCISLFIDFLIKPPLLLLLPFFPPQDSLSPPPLLLFFSHPRDPLIYLSSSHPQTTTLHCRLTSVGRLDSFWSNNSQKMSSWNCIMIIMMRAKIFSGVSVGQISRSLFGWLSSSLPSYLFPSPFVMFKVQSFHCVSIKRLIRKTILKSGGTFHYMTSWSMHHHIFLLCEVRNLTRPEALFSLDVSFNHRRHMQLN